MTKPFRLQQALLFGGFHLTFVKILNLIRFKGFDHQLQTSSSSDQNRIPQSSFSITLVQFCRHLSLSLSLSLAHNLTLSLSHFCAKPLSLSFFLLFTYSERGPTVPPTTCVRLFYLLYTYLYLSQTPFSSSFHEYLCSIRPLY